MRDNDLVDIMVNPQHIAFTYLPALNIKIYDNQ